jgi:4-hydroxy-2-oxoheptanedioate aldolase
MVDRPAARESDPDNDDHPDVKRPQGNPPAVSLSIDRRRSGPAADQGWSRPARGRYDRGGGNVNRRQRVMAGIRPNKVKQKLAAGQTVVSLLGIDSPNLVDQVGPLGIDAIWIEAEHGPIDFGHVPDMTRACDLWGMTSIVRVNALDYGTIYRTLDLGAQGICVPHIDTADHARQFVEAAKFAPLGKRGLFTSRQGYGVSDYLQVANDQTLLVALIEDIRAVENLDEILAVDHIDVFFVAPSDLASSMGLIGQIGDPKVVETIETTLKRIVAAGRTAGTLLPGNEKAEHYTAMGVRCIAVALMPLLAKGMGELFGRIGSR